MEKIRSALSRLIVLSVCFCSCDFYKAGSPTNDIGKLNEVFENCIDLNTILRDSLKFHRVDLEKIIPISIKNGNLLGRAIVASHSSEGNERFYLFVYDTKAKRLARLIKNPFGAFNRYSNGFAYDNGQLYACSESHANCIYIYNFSTGKNDSIAIPPGYRSYLGTPLVDESTIYFVLSPLGTTAFSLTGDTWKSYRNDQNHTINYIYSTVVLSDNIHKTLVSGEKTNEKIKIFSIDSNSNRSDSVSINEDGNILYGQFRIVRTRNSYVIFNGKEMFRLDSKTFKRTWEKVLPNYIVNTMLLNPDRLLYVTSSNLESIITIVDVNSGEKLWSIVVDSRFSINWDISLDKTTEKIVVFSDKKLGIYNFDGVQTGSKNVSDLKGFYTLHDLRTNDIYTFTADNSYLLW